MINKQIPCKDCICLPVCRSKVKTISTDKMLWYRIGHVSSYLYMTCSLYQEYVYHNIKHIDLIKIKSLTSYYVQKKREIFNFLDNS